MQYCSVLPCPLAKEGAMQSVSARSEISRRRLRVIICPITF
jgi:hypothetical protein